MVDTYSLGGVLDTDSPDLGMLKFGKKTLVNLLTEIFDGRVLPHHDNRSIVVRNLSFGLGVDPHQVQVVPGSLQKLIKIPFVESGNGNVVRNTVQNVEFFHRDLIDLIQHVQTGHVDSVSFDDVDNVIDGGVGVEVDVGIEDLVLLADGSDTLLVDSFDVVIENEVEASLLVLLDLDQRLGLVESDAESFQLPLDDLLVVHRSGGVKNDHNQVAGSGDGNNLSTTSFVVFGSLNNSGKIKKLEFGSFVDEDSGNTGQSCELVL